MTKLGKKGSTGIHWDILAIAALVSVGIIFFYSPAQASTPEVGEFPAKLAKSLEETRNKDQIINKILERTFEQSLAQIIGNGIFSSSTECGNYLGYGIIIRKNSECLNNFDIGQNLIKLFQESYAGLKKSKIGGIDFSDVNFEVSIDKGFIAHAQGKVPFSLLSGGGKEVVAYINPSFYSSIGYDLDEYKRIAEKAQGLFNLCTESESLDFCIASNKLQFFASDDFELLDKCEPEEKENFFKIAEYIESCSYSNDNSCICTKNNPSVNGSFQISQDGDDILIIDKNNPELEEKIENAILVDEYIYAGGASYVHKDQEGKVLISGYWDGKTCEPKPKTKFRFCVQSKNSEFYAYNENDKTTKLRPVVYKFALDFIQLSGSMIGSPRNNVLAESADIKERIRQLANEIGFANIELVLKLAKTESSFRHCRDGTSNCGASNPDNVNCNSFGSCGVMQVNNKPNAHEDLFIVGSKRLELFGCKKEETAYDINCNIKSGLRILQQNYQAYGPNTDRYNNAVDEFCKDPALNAKYKSYVNPWDRALRAYNGFGCSIGADVSYVEKVNSADVQSFAADDFESESENLGTSQAKIGSFITKPNIAVSNEYKLAGYDRPEGVIVDTIVLHHTGDDAAVKTYNTLNQRQLGVHYIIDRDGTIYYLVDESKMTYHAKGWNSRSIGIEIVNTGYKSMEYTDVQYDFIRKLINDIADRWPSIEVDDEHIKAHYEVSNIGKWDPSPNFVWSKIGLTTHPTLASLEKSLPDEFGYS